MAAEMMTIHWQTPEKLKIEKAAKSIKDGAVILYPTDTGFALGCQLSNKEAIGRLRQIRGIKQDKSLTFLCESLSNISEFAKVSNVAYRTIKALIPGPYTFILPASREVPKFAQNPKRNTAGIRVPDSELTKMLIEAVGEPIISISARFDGDEEQTAFNPEAAVDHYCKVVDLCIKFDNYEFVGESTVIDMSTDEFAIMREGAGLEAANAHVQSSGT
jgi:tRNA threonylcarbamoyl adenosine modification protein (Sua5/YciO/YrdC/YwlC family)